jgi:hypothetical protein
MLLALIHAASAELCKPDASPPPRSNPRSWRPPWAPSAEPAIVTVQSRVHARREAETRKSLVSRLLHHCLVRD